MSFEPENPNPSTLPARRARRWSMPLVAAALVISAAAPLPAQTGERVRACWYKSDDSSMGPDSCTVGEDLAPCTKAGAVCEVGTTGTCRESSELYAGYHVIAADGDCPETLPYWTDDGSEPFGFNDDCEAEAGDMREAVFVNFQRTLRSSGGPPGSDGEMAWCVSSPDYGVVTGTFGDGGRLVEMAIDGPAKAIRGTPGWSLGGTTGDLEFWWDDAQNKFLGKWRDGLGEPGDPWNEGWEAVPVD